MTTGRRDFFVSVNVDLNILRAVKKNVIRLSHTHISSSVLISFHLSVLLEGRTYYS